MKKKEKIKTIRKVMKLKEDYNNSKTIIEKEYIRSKILRLTTQLIEDKTIENENLELIYKRIARLNKYGNVYVYNLSENLKEQITITTDSIRAAPIHLKKMELNNTAMLQYKDQFEK